MKTFFTSILIVSLFCVSNAQNLVPNGSFEDISNCPQSENEVFLANGWSSFGKTPDYFNSCDLSQLYGVPINSGGYQKAATGIAYCGLFTYAGIFKNYRELIGAQLKSSLINGRKYFVSLKVCLAENSNCATNNIGIKFSTQTFNELLSAPINNNATIHSNSIILDTANWVIVSGAFIADSAYKYIIVGNFFIDSKTDSIIHHGNLCNAYYFIDDVCVSSDSLDCKLITSANQFFDPDKIFVYPNPSSTKIYISKTSSFFSVTLINVLGERIRIFQNQNTIDVSDLPEGIYFIVLTTNNKSIIKKQFIFH